MHDSLRQNINADQCVNCNLPLHCNSVKNGTRNLIEPFTIPKQQMQIIDKTKSQ